MGEIADDMIKGACCSLCGCYFFLTKDEADHTYESYEHGHPVSCKDCWTPDCGFPKADADTL